MAQVASVPCLRRMPLDFDARQGVACTSANFGELRDQTARVLDENRCAMQFRGCSDFWATRGSVTFRRSKLFRAVADFTRRQVLKRPRADADYLPSATVIACPRGVICTSYRATVVATPLLNSLTGTRLRNDEALDRLAGQFGDHLEVLVKVEDGQPGELSGGRDDHVSDRGCAVLPEVCQTQLHFKSSVLDGRCLVFHGHGRQRRSTDGRAQVWTRACAVADLQAGDGADAHQSQFDLLGPLGSIGTTPQASECGGGDEP